MISTTHNTKALVYRFQKHTHIVGFIFAELELTLRNQNFGQATTLFLTVAVIELSDIAFAVDSITAVFGVTQDPFVVFTSNLLAILGVIFVTFPFSKVSIWQPFCELDSICSLYNLCEFCAYNYL